MTSFSEMLASLPPVGMCNDDEGDDYDEYVDIH